MYAQNLQRNADRHSDRYVSRKKFTLRQICDRALRFFGGFDFVKSSSLLSSGLDAASGVLFGARLKIPDPNPSAKDYPRDITVIVDFFSFASFHTALSVGGSPIPSHVRFVFSIFLVLSLSHIIRRLSHSMRHHICNHWPATLWRIGEFSVKIVRYNGREIFSHMRKGEQAKACESERGEKQRAKYKNILQ